MFDGRGMSAVCENTDRVVREDFGFQETTSKKKGRFNLNIPTLAL